MKLFLAIPNVENKEYNEVYYETFERCKIIHIYLKPMKKGLEDIQNIRAFTSDIIKLKETILDKRHMKMFEEVSPEISEILEKLDKPDNLLELGLERVQGMGFSQEGASMEQLPVTLKTQVEHWSTTRDSKIREKMDFLAQAVDRIEKMRTRV